MVDKGFAIATECKARNLTLYIPNKRKQGQQFTENEIKQNAGVARARVNVERKIKIVKHFKIFSGKLDRVCIEYADELFIIACGIANLNAPILQDKYFAEFELKMQEQDETALDFEESSDDTE